jgi:excisionase family DNA binding protein
VPELVTRDEAAEVLRIHVRTLDRLIQRGELPAVRVGGNKRGRVRVTRAALEAYIAARERTNGHEEPERKAATNRKATPARKSTSKATTTKRR